MSDTFQKKLENYLDAGYSAIWIETPEEFRIATDLMAVVAKLREQGRNALKPINRVCSWSSSKGWEKTYPVTDEEAGKRGKKQRTELQPVEALERILSDGEAPGTMLVMQDVDSYLLMPRVRRLLRDCASELRETDKVLILVSVSVTLPSDLAQDILVMEYSLPNEDELGGVLDELTERNDIKRIVDEEREAVVSSAKGLTSGGAEDAFSLSLIESGSFDPAVVSREKAAAVRKSGALSIYEPKDLPDVGGMFAVKDWLDLRRLSMSKEARDFGIPTAKGLMLLGLSGCGKSLIAKQVGKQWNIPLIRFDLGAVMAGRVGQSEENMRAALRLAEACAPCGLWIDEVDKGFAGVKGSAGGLDSGVKAAVFGTFITWMQEKTTPVFVIATANDVENLPPELMRRGRFDELFFADLPTVRAREDILRIHLEKRDRKLDDKAIKALALRLDKFTGAEIEQVVIDALLFCFQDDKRAITAMDLKKAADLTTPLAETMAETMERLREWSKGRARDAETVETKGAARRSKGRGGRRLTGGGSPDMN